MGYQFECEKPLHKGVGVKMTIFSVNYFLNEPKDSHKKDENNRSCNSDNDCYVSQLASPDSCQKTKMKET